MLDNQPNKQTKKDNYLLQLTTDSSFHLHSGHHDLNAIMIMWPSCLKSSDGFCKCRISSKLLGLAYETYGPGLACLSRCPLATPTAPSPNVVFTSLCGLSGSFSHLLYFPSALRYCACKPAGLSALIILFHPCVAGTFSSIYMYLCQGSPLRRLWVTFLLAQAKLWSPSVFPSDPSALLLF